MKDRVLFVLKYRHGYGHDSVGYFSSGLYWSAKFVASMLNESGIDAKLVQVVDNNSIDKEVALFKPTVVVVEALWVVPEKFDVLKRRHPRVKWIVRLHSNIPFLANEGIAISWIKRYVAQGVHIAVNDTRTLDSIRSILRASFLPHKVIYLPNFYPASDPGYRPKRRHFISVGCYGAIRPLKNQLIQAVAAIKFADRLGKELHFHINSGRIEGGGNPTVRNLQALFRGTRHRLVEDCWMDHHDFMRKLKHIDVGMQVSLSETFSIISADMVTAGVPVVVSPEVQWAGSFSKVDPTDVESIIQGLTRAYKHGTINVWFNTWSLDRFCRMSKNIWINFLSKETVCQKIMEGMS